MEVVLRVQRQQHDDHREDEERVGREERDHREAGLVLADMAEAFAGAALALLFFLGRALRAAGQGRQRDHQRHEGRRVQVEGPFGAVAADEIACGGRADEAGGVEDRAVDGDGLRDVFLRDEFRDDRRGGGHLEGTGDAEQGRGHDEVPGVQRAVRDELADREREADLRELADLQDEALVVTVGVGAAEAEERQHDQSAGEVRRGLQQPFVILEAVADHDFGHHPAERHALHPGARHRDSFADHVARERSVREAFSGGTGGGGGHQNLEYGVSSIEYRKRMQGYLPRNSILDTPYSLQASYLPLKAASVACQAASTAGFRTEAMAL